MYLRDFLSEMLSRYCPYKTDLSEKSHTFCVCRMTARWSLTFNYNVSRISNFS